MAALTVFSGWSTVFVTYLPRALAHFFQPQADGQRADGQPSYEPWWDHLGWTGFLITVAAVAVLGLIAINLSRYHESWIGENLAANLKSGLLEKISRSPLNTFATVSMGSVAQRFTGDVHRVRELLITEASTAIQHTVLLTLVLASLAREFFSGDHDGGASTLLWGLAGVLLILPLWAGVRFARKRLEALAHQILKTNEALMTKFIETIEGYHELASAGRFSEHSRRFSTGLGALIKLQQRARAWGSVAFSLPQLVFLVLPIAWYAYQTYQHLGTPTLGSGGGVSAELVGKAGTFASQIILLQIPIIGLNRFATQWNTAAPSFLKMRSYLDGPEFTIPADPKPLPKHYGIEFEEVVYSPTRSRPPVIQGASFEIPEGSYTAIVGESGSGKSTLFNLLLRLVEPQSGEVRLAGCPIQDLDHSDYRRLFGFIPQHSVMFDGSLRENLLLYQDGPADEARLLEAIELAGLERLVKQRGLDSTVGRSGATLAGGERQRVALARLFLRDPKIIICDEYTANVDNATVRIIQESLAKRFAGRTRVVITHQLYTIRDADHILVLDHGRIIQSGTHDSLSQQEGPYRELWNVQRLQ